MTEDEMVGWHHRFDGHGFEQASGVGDGQGNLACCSPWGHKELDKTWQLNNCSVAKLCLTLCNPIDCSTLGALSTVSWSLLKFMSILRYISPFIWLD